MSVATVSRVLSRIKQAALALIGKERMQGILSDWRDLYGMSITVDDRTYRLVSHTRRASSRSNARYLTLYFESSTSADKIHEDCVE